MTQVPLFVRIFSTRTFRLSTPPKVKAKNFKQFFFDCGLVSNKKPERQALTSQRFHRSPQLEVEYGLDKNVTP